MKVEGHCHCGAIRYRADVDPARANICHCTDCQRLTGTAYRAAVPAPAESFELLAGAPTIYIKTADSGAKRAHAFCPTCGAPIYATSVDTPTSYSLRIGALDRRSELAPQRQIWCSSSFGWAQDISGLPGTERQ